MEARLAAAQAATKMELAASQAATKMELAAAQTQSEQRLAAAQAATFEKFEKSIPAIMFKTVVSICGFGAACVAIWPVFKEQVTASLDTIKAGK